MAFRGGELTAVMGGVELDLRAGGPRTAGRVDVFAIWGGIDIRVPDDWRVEFDATSVIGGLEDARGCASGETAGTLVVRGFVMMGGVEVPREAPRTASSGVSRRGRRRCT